MTVSKFSIRKLTVGAASVLIGVLFLTSWNTNTVYADSINGESIAKSNNPQEGNPAVNKDNVQIVDNDSTEVSNISDSKSSKVIKSDATKSDIVRDKTTIDDNSGTKVPEHTAQANNKQALTTVTEDNGAKVSKTEKYSNSDIKKQPKNSEKTQETTLVKKVLDKEKLSSESLIEEKLSSESLIDPKKSDEKVEIPATDPSNTIPASDPITYPEELNGLINKDGKDKYIYQVLSLDGYSHSKLILSVNRNNHKDKKIYAYVIDGNKKVKQSKIIDMDQQSIITIDGRKYQLDNNGSREVFIGRNKVSIQNSSTVTSQPWNLDNNPIGQDYGLGNTSTDKCAAIGEIVPVFTTNSVIKYYYRDNKGHLQEFKNSELPNVSVEGFTGQKFEIDNVAKYKRVVIPGYHLISDNIPDNLPKGNFNGTLSQFSDDKYYKKVYYDFHTGEVKYSVLYHQISPDGTMKVRLFDDEGNPLTESRVIEPDTSTKFTLQFTHYIGYGRYEYITEDATVRNPYVTAAPHEVQLIYAKNGKIIPVDKNHNPIKGADQPVFPTDPKYPSKVDSVEIPDLSAMGYHPLDKAVKTVDPDSKDPSKDIEVEYVKSSTISVKYHDNTEDKDIDGYGKNASGDEDDPFNYDPATDLATLKGKGYVLDGDLPKIPDKFPDEDKTVIIPLKHGTKKVSRNDDVNMTVHYVMDDDSKAPSDNKQTVNFTENGTQDLVTQKITWTPADSQKFDDVATPVITGYTPDQDKVIGQTANFETDNREVTVTYHANAQTAKITYIDDTTKNNLDSKDASGKFGQAITFATAPTDEIANYKKQGYVLVSNSFDNNKYQADNNNNVFYVHFIHGTKKVNRNDDVNMTVHYVMDDDSKAPSDNKQTVNFTENGTQDLVTQKITWTPADSQTLNDVESPVLTGYTADIKTAKGKVVNFGDPDINVTVHYSANAQTAKIIYIDDTTKNNLDSKDANGKFGQAITFATAPTDEIANYKKQGYVLVSNSFDNNKYQADNNNNVFYVHFIHGTKKVNREHSASFTVHYIYKDGGQAKPDHEQTLSFTENGIQDLVTQKITWTPADSQKFDDVATPVITGYTPDQDKVIGQTAKFETDNREVTVTYLPDVQLGHINYIDDNTGKTLTRDDFSGRTNEHEDYTPIDRIQKFENKGYELVSNDYPDGGFNFDDNDQQEQVFNVHLKHGIVTVTTKKPQTPNMPINPDPQSPKYPKDISNTNSDVKRTIDYKFKDGKTAQPTVNDSLHFERTVVIDKVTGDVLSDTWTPSQDFNDVQTPVIQGYTPDRTVVSDTNIGHDHQNIVEHVIYNPDAQHMTITYVDDTTRETLKQDKLDGTSDQDAKYTTGNSIKQYEDQHYKLVSDSTNGKDLIFDHDDNANQTYEVHFVHGTQKVNRQDTVTSTIDYKFEDGKTAQPTVTQTKHFSEDGVKDLVTGKIAWDEAKPQKFDDVATPDISGYTPDKDNVAGSTVKFGDKDVEVTVTYHNNVQKAVITYIDDTEKKTLGSDKQDGKFNQVIIFEHDPAEVIKGLEEKGYKLVSDNFKPGIKYQNDNKLNIFEVHLVHTYEPVETSQTITETVHYIDANGKPVAPDHVAKVVIKVTGTRDKVTDSIIWNTPSTGHFDEVISPEVPNMTPDKKLIPGRDVQYGDSDITESVVYTPDNSTSKTPEKPDKPSKEVSKTPEKPDKPSKEVSKIPEKPNKSSKEVSKAPEKSIDSRTVDNHVSAKSTAKRELPQTGATTNTGIWTGLVSMIASLGLLGASKRRKKN